MDDISYAIMHPILIRSGPRENLGTVEYSKDPGLVHMALQGVMVEFS